MKGVNEMKNASKTMYKIGRIFNFVLLGLAALLIVIYTIIMIVRLANNEGLWYLGTIIGLTIWLAIIIVTIIFATRAIKAIDEDEKNNAPHITMIVFGAISGDVFYLLGGIFGLVAISQETENSSDNK